MNQTDRAYALSSLWAAAKEIYPYFDRLPLCWDDAYRQYLPKLLEETDDTRAWLLLSEFVRLLNDAHSTVILPQRIREQNGVFPFRLKHIGEHFIITQAQDEGLLLREVLSIDGIAMPEWVAQLNRYQYTVNGHPYQGRLESWLPLLLNGRAHTLQTDAGKTPFHFSDAKATLLCAPVPRCKQDAQDVGEQMRLFDGGILCVRIGDMMHTDHAAAFQAALAKHRPKAVIFDIRDNIGGMTLCGARYAQPFFEDSFGGSSKWTQRRLAVDAASHSQLSGMSEAQVHRMLKDGTLTPDAFDQMRKYASRTHYERYRDAWQMPCDIFMDQCPVVLLTSRDTISAAEDFTCFFKSNKRGVIMGENTFGSTGSPYLLQLPDGGRGQIVSVGYEMLDGTPFIGCGIAPNIPCVPTMEDYRSGIDRQLDAALDYLRGRTVA